MTHYTIGTHLKVARTGYTHHGIYIGGGMVIHYAGFAEAFKYAPVEVVTLKEFQGNSKYIKEVSYPNPCFSAEEIVERAMSRLAENRYSLVFNNCEHFAHWCVMGKSASRQVKIAVSTVASFVGLFFLPMLTARADMLLNFF